MQISTVSKSILAAGILAAAVATILLKRSPIPSGGGVDGLPLSGPPREDSFSAGPRPPRRSAGPVSAGETDSKSQTLLRSLEDLASRDPHQALAKLAGIEDPAVRSSALAAIAAGWARTDAPAAAKWVAGLESEDEATDAALGLVPVWAAVAPTDCLAWATGRPPGILREMSLTALADAWGSSNPREAFSRFLALESDEGKERGLHAIVSQWALDAPQASVDYFSHLDGASRRDEFLQTALVCLSNEEPNLTWKYSDRCSDPKIVEHVRSMALEAMAESRPQDAIKLAASGGNSEVLLAGIARGWSSADAGAAKAWIGTLPDRELSARLLDAISDEP